MGNAIPIITANSPAISEIVNNQTGWLLEKQSHSENLKGILREIVETPEIIRQKGTAAKKFIEEHHSWKIFKKEVQNFYAN